MHRVTYQMGMSLDGYVADSDGNFDWSEPSAEQFRFHIEELRGLHAHLLGRRLYETMTYWEDPANAATFDAAEREWAELWNALPKLVFSHTLTAVSGAARLATEDLATEIARLKDQPGDGDIAIGGADLAHQVAALGLIDEYQVIIGPAVVGGGTAFFAHDGRHEHFSLVENRTFDGGNVLLRYAVER
ncbi:dihydrofolate reductase family protein [Demequina sp. NBRC 110051]|uniref:dihydrofolate reductase family protein n=1 Tax=Demequina sp. NBRC 110051 TaxID=1570340 RepID=UPI000A021542|nr:dihydrofolate reductase family protein [Demequina sp. NBRC 110051]